MTAARPDRAARYDHGGSGGLVTDPEPDAYLSQRETVWVEVGHVLTDRLRQLWLTCHQAPLLGYPAYCAAVYREPCGQLPDRYPRGVPVEQVGSIRDAQTGLTLTQVFLYWPAQIVGTCGGRGRRAREPRRTREISDPSGFRGFEKLPRSSTVVASHDIVNG